MEGEDGGMDGDNLPFRPSEHIINFKAIAGYGPVKVSTTSMERFLVRAIRSTTADEFI